MTFPVANRRRHANPIQIAPLFGWLAFAAIIAACGLLYVYVKNQQHALGGQKREVEKAIAEVRAHNEVLLARISALSSRLALQRKLDQGLIALMPIQDASIARLSPPVSVGRDKMLRTAANERLVP